MEALRPISEVKILQDVRLLHSGVNKDLSSIDNLNVEFVLSDEIKGSICCFLLLDGLELSTEDKNYIFPLFVESMNILIGRQLSSDEKFNQLSIKLSAPKLSMIPMNLSETIHQDAESFSLVIGESTYKIVIASQLEILN